MKEECTAIAVCVFVGSSSMTWTLEVRSFDPDEEHAAVAYAAAERERGHHIAVTRRFTRVDDVSRQSEWRIGAHVIVESEDFRLRPRT